MNQSEIREGIWQARNKMLDLHKLLIDAEKREIELISGGISPAQFLGLLMEDAELAWLRLISGLIVRIDESFDAKDGIPNDLLEELRREVEMLFDDGDHNAEFKSKLAARAGSLPDAEAMVKQILASTKA
ncbi:MAG: hypothetical protein R2684_07580 [Pyrinomonadaceae bacterium]